VNDTVQRAKKVIADYLDMKPEAVTEEASFVEDLDMDSLATMELVMALEEEFSISMEDRAVESIKTVGDAILAIDAAVA
jgi:acyl carrier protein